MIDIDPIVSEDVVIYDSEIFFDGYTLIAPVRSNFIYLVDMEGFPVHSWESQHLGLANYLQSDGSLYRTFSIPNNVFNFGGRTGGIEKFDFEGNLLWSWEYTSETYTLHHDLAILPNGNILASVWDLKNKEEAILVGRNPDLLINDSVWPDRIIEIKPEGTNQAQIVWEWSVWDHLVQDFDSTKDNFGDISSHPERLNINYTIGDANFNHINALFYIEPFDQIVFSSRRFSEVFVLDHSTTTQEAKESSGGLYNKGGDILYRWGNPEAYDVGTTADRRLYEQHDIRWIGDLPKNGNGNFLVFNNNPLPEQSTINEIKLPQNQDGSFNLTPNMNNSPLDFAWTYANPEIYAPRVSGAQRLLNGNTLITEGTEGVLYEINAQSKLVWQYKIPLEVPDVFKCFRYPLDYPAFENKNLDTIDIPIE